MDQEQTPQNPTDTAPGEEGSLDAAALAFEKREEEAPETDQTEQPDPNAEAEEGQPDEDTGEPELEEFEFNGHKLTVPKDVAAELQKAALRQSDYSRKMNEVSELGKKYAQQIEKADLTLAAAEKLADAKAKKAIAEHTAKQYEKVDWATLRNDDPGRAALLAVEAMNARQAAMMADQEIQRALQEANEAQGQGFAVKRAEMHETLTKKLKGWDDSMGTAITQYATSIGVAHETLSKLTDPGVVIALEKARKYDELQQKKADIKSAPKAVPPVLKPGAPRKPDAQADAMARLRKTNSVDDAAALFLARMK